MRVLAASIVCAAALGGLVAVAGASHQAAKAGCTSAAVPGGSLVTPGLNIQPNTVVNLVFRYWWEVESIDPAQDAIAFDVSRDGGLSWEQVLNLTPAAPAGATADRPISNLGFGAAPDWQQQTVNLNALNVFNNPSVRFRFRFQSGTTLRQGFRGFAVDELAITGTNNVLNESFEGGALPPSWEASGYWHVQADPQTLRVAPGINPELVTLPDAGFLPADPTQGNRHVAWFGEAATGTYCGTESLVELSLAPGGASPFLDETHRVTAFAGGAPAGTQVRWGVAGANPAAGSAPVDPATGQAPIAWIGAAAGRDTLSAFVDLSGDGVQQPFEPGATATADWRQRTLDDLADPVPFRDVNVQPVAGDVYVKLPAGASPAARAALGGARTSQTKGAPAGFVSLKQAGKVPVGSQIDVSKGRVMLESAANRTGSLEQRAQFYLGRFTVLQRRATRPVTEMVLKGGSFRRCPSSRAKGSSAGDGPEAQSSARRRGRRVRRLWGNGKGRFRTRGRYSSATVRGTKWVTQDHCGGTFTRVARRPRTNRVVVRDLVRRRSVTLRAGRSHFAARRGK